MEPCSSLDIIKEIVEELKKNKCTDIVVLDVKGLCTFTDFFIVCSGIVSTHVEMVSVDMSRWLKCNKVKISGSKKGPVWSLIDCGNFVLHIFASAERSFYDIESLWENAKVINF